MDCKLCEYPGAGPVVCPECGAEIDAVLVEEWDDGGVTVHYPVCRKPVENVLDAGHTGGNWVHGAHVDGAIELC